MTEKYRDKLLEILELAKFAKNKGRLSSIHMGVVIYQTTLDSNNLYKTYFTIEEVEKVLINDYRIIRKVKYLQFNIKLKFGRRLVWGNTNRTSLTSFWNIVKHNI